MKEVEKPTHQLVATEAMPISEVPDRRGHRMAKYIVRGGSAGFFGAGAALAGFNAYGAQSEIGPLHVSTHLVFDKSVGITSDFADIRSEEWDWPIGAYADVNRSNNDAINPEQIAKDAGIIGDPRAIGEQLRSDYIYQSSLAAGAGLAGGVAVESLVHWATRPERRKRAYAGLYTASAIGSAALLSLPTYSYKSIPWQSTEVSIDGTTTSIGYAGAGASSIVNEIGRSERYYNSIKEKVITSLQPIATEDTLIRPGDTKMLFYSDWHCNYGIARVIGQIAKSMQIKTTINGGDSVMSGTSAENICVDMLAKNLPDTDNIAIAGNHDTPLTMARMKQRGFNVLDNQLKTVNGLEIFGTTDPFVTPPYAGMMQRSPELSPEIFRAHTTKSACESKPEILLTHEPNEALVSTEALSCAHVTLSGHTHQQSKARKVGPESYRLITGTAGGAAPNRMTLTGTLGREASFTIIYAKDGRVTGYRIIAINPNTQVDVGDYSPIE